MIIQKQKQARSILASISFQSSRSIRHWTWNCSANLSSIDQLQIHKLLAIFHVANGLTLLTHAVTTAINALLSPLTYNGNGVCVTRPGWKLQPSMHNTFESNQEGPVGCTSEHACPREPSPRGVVHYIIMTSKPIKYMIALASLATV